MEKDKTKYVDYSKYDTETLARWCNTFNGWEWPDDFPVNKPSGYDRLPHWNEFGFDSKEDYKYWKNIHNFIGQKEYLRWHHLNNINIPKSWMFEVWWIFSQHVFPWIGRTFRKYNFYFDVYKIMGVGNRR